MDGCIGHMKPLKTGLLSFKVRRYVLQRAAIDRWHRNRWPRKAAPHPSGDTCPTLKLGSDNQHTHTKNLTSHNP